MSTNPTLSLVDNISLMRTEGQLATSKATTFASANRVLRAWARTAPASGGYDKVRVEIHWANGTKYAYRLDLTHPSTGKEVNIEQDVSRDVDFALGRLRHPKWSDAQHENAMRRLREQGVVAIAQQVDALCAIGDLPSDAQMDRLAQQAEPLLGAAAGRGKYTSEPPPEGWAHVDEATPREMVPGALYMRQMGGGDSGLVRWDLTIVHEVDGDLVEPPWVPMHGGVSLQRAPSAAAAAQMLMDYYEQLPESSKVAAERPYSRERATG